MICEDGDNEDEQKTKPQNGPLGLDPIFHGGYF